MKIGLISAIAGIPTRYPFDGYGGIERIVADLSHAFQEMGIETIVAGFTGTNAGDVNMEMTAETPMDRIDADVVFDFSHRKIYQSEKFSIPFWSDVVGKNPLFPTWAVRWAMFGNPTEPIIYPGIDVKSIMESVRETDRSGYVYVGRIAPYKGIDTLLDLMRRFNISIEFYGHVGPYSDPVYAERVDGRLREMGANVIHRNPSNAEIYDAFSHARAFLFMPDWNMLNYNIPRPIESFGITAVESLACGTPVYTDRMVSGIREIISTRYGVVLPSYIVKWDSSIVFDRNMMQERAVYFSSENYAKRLLDHVGRVNGIGSESS